MEFKSALIILTVYVPIPALTTCLEYPEDGGVLLVTGGGVGLTEGLGVTDGAGVLLGDGEGEGLGLGEGVAFIEATGLGEGVISGFFITCCLTKTVEIITKIIIPRTILGSIRLC